jgi:anti-sigma28 factor (negative regulator of flagellin synthesis)
MNIISNVNATPATPPTADKERSVAAKSGLDNQIRGADSLEISAGAARLANFEEARTQRSELISRVRGEIGNGSYESANKVDATVEKLFSILSSVDLHA